MTIDEQQLQQERKMTKKINRMFKYDTSPERLSGASKKQISFAAGDGTSQTI